MWDKIRRWEDYLDTERVSVWDRELGLDEEQREVAALDQRSTRTISSPWPEGFAGHRYVVNYEESCGSIRSLVCY